MGDKVVVGKNHGDAFSKLNQKEQVGEIESGFIDQESGKFFTEEYNFYLKQIYIIRHGEAEGQEFFDPLTENGIQQCINCGNFLTSQPIADFQIYCSPFDRCVQSSQIISRITTLPYQQLNCLQKKKDKESSQEFIARIDESLATISSKAIVISHADVILEMVSEAIGPQFCIEFASGIPNCSVTLIDARRLIRCITVK